MREQTPLVKACGGALNFRVYTSRFDLHPWWRFELPRANISLRFASVVARQLEIREQCEPLLCNGGTHKVNVGTYLTRLGVWLRTRLRNGNIFMVLKAMVA